MSNEIIVAFEVRDLLIMKETVKELGYDFTEPKENCIEIEMSYHPIVIDANTGNIKHDSDHKSQVDKIKQSYMVNFYKDKAIREGLDIEEVVQPNGEVVINIL